VHVAAPKQTTSFTLMLLTACHRSASVVSFTANLAQRHVAFLAPKRCLLHSSPSIFGDVAMTNEAGSLDWVSNGYTFGFLFVGWFGGNVTRNFVANALRHFVGTLQDSWSLFLSEFPPSEVAANPIREVHYP